ncbi:hypothetical protein DFJ58DRAFT_725430 [Suillus subalutaceus]|uniref:uncharacterized protein n=1 Tax=Suillus subalutaceus TaxID=48586 RepID=UPI001B864ABE|nr:uncharacterized protein DFJ58DRAFT_725430 [Suillus subalutaceus]KAG1862599.1 hypothetical protein DFJ58DRAFT_725430 [Suillus subalutaceus]
MLSTLFAVIVSIFIIGFTATATSYPTSNVIPGCRRNTDSFSFSIPFILLSVFQLVLVSLTLVCVIQSWRSAKGPLYAILVKHNIFYYTCGLLLSTVNVLAPVLLVLPLSDFLSYFLPEAFEVFILAILATRMHLHLWRMDQQVDDPDIVSCGLFGVVCEVGLGLPTFSSLVQHMQSYVSYLFSLSDYEFLCSLLSVLPFMPVDHRPSLVLSILCHKYSHIIINTLREPLQTQTAQSETLKEGRKLAKE